MKKIIALVFLFCLVLNLQAQEDKKNDDRMPFSFGPVLGLNYSRVSTKALNDQNTNLKSSDILGFHAGLFARIHYHKLYFQPQVLVTWKGGICNYDIVNPANSVEQKIKVTSLDFPLLIGYNFGRSFLNFRLFAGPEVGYNMTEKEKITTTGAELLPEQKFNLKDATWSITGGIGFDVWKFTMDLRYVRGLNNVSWNSDFKQHPGCFLLSIGWKTM